MDFPSLEELESCISATLQSIDSTLRLIPPQFLNTEETVEAQPVTSKYHHKKRSPPSSSKIENGVKLKKAKVAEEVEVEVTPGKNSEERAEKELLSPDTQDAFSAEQKTVHERLMELQAARQTKNPRKIKAKELKLMKKAEAKKDASTTKKKSEAKKHENYSVPKLPIHVEHASNSKKVEALRKTGGKSASKVTEALDFGNVKFGDSAMKQKGPSKKDVKAQLMRAEKRLEKIQQCDDEKAKQIKESNAWKKAALQASGERVKDDVRLLKKAVKRKEKLKQAKKEEWSKRKNDLNKQMKERQKKRAENIKKRVEAKATKSKKKRK